MNSELAVSLRMLVAGKSVAALGTLHQGLPFVSMVPFAVLSEGFVIHVSRLAAHTGDMLATPDVSLLITESEDSGKMPQELARVTVQGQAARLDLEGKNYAGARAAYLARFPDAAPLFEFSDFSLFIIAPVGGRFIAGFGLSVTLSAEDFNAVLPA
jgi:putative heme iron utilization protein